MQQRILPALSEAASQALERNSQRVASATGRQAQYLRAKALFSAKTPATAFREIRRALESGAHCGTCYYCERDRYRDVDHVLPQSVYPELAFTWTNYVYAYTICNQDNKKHRCAVISDAGDIVDCTRFHSTDDIAPAGQPCLLNPRIDNPLDFIEINLETGIFLPLPGLSIGAAARANYTITTLGLNSDLLSRSRRIAYRFYLSSIRNLLAAANDNDFQRVSQSKEDILQSAHPTVFLEMQRQADAIPGLANLLNEAAAHLQP